MAAKCQELVDAGVHMPTDTAVIKAITDRRDAGEFAALILISNRHPSSWCAPAQGGDDQHMGGAEVAHQMPTIQLKL